MSILIFLCIIVVHYIADFIFQDEQWALNKSKSKSALLKHTLTYSSLWLLSILIITQSVSTAFYFAIVTFMAHTIQDDITSRIVSKRFKNEYYGSSIPNFGAFSMIGLDQVFHYIQLIITWRIFL